MFTNNKEFQSANEERQIELIKINAYNSMIKYLRGTIDYFEIRKEISDLTNLGIVDNIEIFEFLKNKIAYEAYQCSIGKNETEKNETEKNEIRNRMIKFKDD